MDARDHDLAGAWAACLVRRIGSRLVISGPIEFGHGDPFDGDVGREIRALVTRESLGVVDDIAYEYADRPPPKLRRAKTGNLDVYPEFGHLGLGRRRAGL